MLKFMTETIVDAHSHLVWPHGGERANDPDILDPEEFISNGIISKMWVMSTGTTMRHNFNDQNMAVLELAKKFPDFVIPFAYVDFSTKPETIDEFAKLGFAGLKTVFPHYAYDDERCFPFYERAEKHHMPFVFHTGGAKYIPKDVGFFANEVFPERALSRNMLVITLDAVVKYFPQLTVVAAHAGGSDGLERCIYTASGHPNFYFDLSCSPLERNSLHRMREVVERVGDRKILFGADSMAVAEMKAIFWKTYLMTRGFFKPEQIANILGTNALRLIQESNYKGFDKTS